MFHVEKSMACPPRYLSSGPGSLKLDYLQTVASYYYRKAVMMCWPVILRLRMRQCGGVEGMAIANE